MRAVIWFCCDVINAPDSLPTDAKALRALILAERARHAEELAAARDAKDHAQDEIARLMTIIKELQRHRFGRRSERLDADQLMLAFEDVEQAIAAAQAAAEKNAPTRPKPSATLKRNINRGVLPAHLPREEVMIDVSDKTCACCGGLKHRIGEDVSERLDVIPAQLKVIVTRRPKYACDLHRESVASPGAGASDRERHSDRGSGRTCVGRQICRPSAALSAGANLRPAGHHA